jgi:hypothetical protein
MLPHHAQQSLEEHLERRSDPWRFERKLKNFHVLQPLLYVPWDQRSWKVTKSVDTRKGGYVCLYIPTEILMTEFNGRLTDSGQVVTDQIIPFSKIKGGWSQDFNKAWQRLIVPSGDDQVVRIGRIRSAIVTTKESVLRLAKQCLSAEEQPYGESTMDAMSPVHQFENNMIPEGGREQYDGRVRLVDYILEKKAVTEAGCRYCPHCRNKVCHLLGVLDSARKPRHQTLQDH